ncbi:MAG: Lrp/AsnC family transcriptional regulator [Haloquadratum sp.]|jgi:transcriptional regulator, AsnC family|nr:Lrp/AsnC family transcriptional regulator [Haloquadratum sp.]
MDALDREILEHLRHDGRRPYTEIAAAVGTSEGTVRNRVEQLLADGIIERFTVTTRRGNIKAMVAVRVRVDVDTAAVTAVFATWPEVDYVWQVSGNDDVVLIVDAADTTALNALITRVRDRDEVRDTHTRLILDEQLGGA